MPRSLKTKLTKRVQELQTQIEATKEFLEMKEEELEDVRELIRTKGPFTKKKLNAAYFAEGGG